MRKLLLFLLIALCLGACAEQAPIPSDWEICENAKPLFEIVFSCPSASSFEESPDAFFADEVIRAYLSRATQGEAASAEQVYHFIFQNGEYMPFPENEQPIPIKPFPARATIESAIDSGAGAIIASLRIENDYGFGMEFSYYVDVHIVPDQEAPFGARITRIFFPE